jgi:hypothetical protein
VLALPTAAGLGAVGELFEHAADMNRLLTANATNVCFTGTSWCTHKGRTHIALGEQLVGLYAEVAVLSSAILDTTVPDFVALGPQSAVRSVGNLLPAE